MSKLNVVTFVDSIDYRVEILQKSCKKNNLQLDIIVPEIKKWNNLYTIKALRDYLAGIEEDTICLVVDAFDVIVFGNEKEILSSFLSFNSDLLFSTEYFFFTREKKKRRLASFDRYPDKNHLYPFLNSGSYIGYVKSIINHIDNIVKNYNIEFDNVKYMKKNTSDQTVFIKYFIDNYSFFRENDFKDFKLDYNHRLFECTGGRRRVGRYSLKNPVKDMLYARFQRRLVLKSGDNLLQSNNIDVSYDPLRDRIHNSRMATNPILLHIPGCKDKNDFDFFLNALKYGKVEYGLIQHLKRVKIMLIARFKTELTYYFGSIHEKKGESIIKS